LNTHPNNRHWLPGRVATLLPARSKETGAGYASQISSLFALRPFCHVEVVASFTPKDPVTHPTYCIALGLLRQKLCECGGQICVAERLGKDRMIPKSFPHIGFAISSAEDEGDAPFQQSISYEIAVFSTQIHV
jgi:hypothetical protein